MTLSIPTSPNPNFSLTQGQGTPPGQSWLPLRDKCPNVGLPSVPFKQSLLRSISYFFTLDYSDWYI